MCCWRTWTNKWKRAYQSQGGKWSNHPLHVMLIGLGSMDSHVDRKINSKMLNRICSGLKVVNWLKIQERWNHLRGIPFLLDSTRFHHTFCLQIKRKEATLTEDNSELNSFLKCLWGLKGIGIILTKWQLTPEDELAQDAKVNSKHYWGDPTFECQAALRRSLSRCKISQNSAHTYIRGVLWPILILQNKAPKGDSFLYING